VSRTARKGHAPIRAHSRRPTGCLWATDTDVHKAKIVRRRPQESQQCRARRGRDVQLRKVESGAQCAQACGAECGTRGGETSKRRAGIKEATRGPLGRVLERGSGRGLEQDQPRGAQARARSARKRGDDENLGDAVANSTTSSRRSRLKASAKESRDRRRGGAPPPKRHPPPLSRPEQPREARSAASSRHDAQLAYGSRKAVGVRSVACLVHLSDRVPCG
jgi:hypothetical protein